MYSKNMAQRDAEAATNARSRAAEDEEEIAKCRREVAEARAKKLAERSVPEEVCYFSL